MKYIRYASWPSTKPLTRRPSTTAIRLAGGGTRRFAIEAGAMAAMVLAAGHSAAAQAAERGPLLDLPVASAAPAAEAAVVSEIPFNKFVRLKCNSNSTSCIGRLPSVPAGERWAVQFMSCQASTAVDATLRYFFLLVTDAGVTKQRGFHYVAPTYRSPGPPHYFVVSQPVVLSVAAGNVLHVAVTSIGAIGDVDCALSGIKQKLR